MPSPDQIRAAVDGYAKAFEAGDREGWLALFAEHVHHEDPVGSPPNTNRDAVGRFWDTVRQLADSFEFDVRDVVVCGAEAAVSATVNARSDAGGGTSIDVVDVFTVDDDGRIASLKAYWDAGHMRPLTDDRLNLA